jgi:hypothetical protein
MYLRVTAFVESDGSALHQEDKLLQKSSQRSLISSRPHTTTFTPLGVFQVVPQVRTRLEGVVMRQGSCLEEHVPRKLAEFLQSFDAGSATTDLNGHVW